MGETYQEMFYKKFKKCKSKKDYKRLCRDMIVQFEAIDKVDKYQWEILTSMLGEDIYSGVMALAIKMYILDKQGISCDVIPVEDY